MTLAQPSIADIAAWNQWRRDNPLAHPDLRRADLTRTQLNWDSPDIISAILANAAGDDYDRRALAGALLVSRDWCWDQWIALPLLLDWVRVTLAPWVRREDMPTNAYAFLRLDTEDLS